MTVNTPVLIVGGGPIGLAVALDLAYQGVPSVVVERGPETGGELLAKAGTLSARSLEFCRRWGIADAVSNWGADPTYPRDTCYVTALSGGHVIGRDKVASAKERTDVYSPEMLRKCPQHIFDPILARAVAATGLVDVRYSTEFTAFEQDETGIDAVLTDLDSGASGNVRAQFLVAADGAGSEIRRQLDIPFEGRTLDYSVSVMIRVATLDEYHPIGKATRYVLMDTEGTWANLTSVDYGDLWRLTLLGAEERISPDRVDVRAMVEKAFGRDDVPFEVLSARPWRRSQCVARRYRDGRVLLVGDAAHTMSPTGGHGLNTGLGDVIGLGWVLAAIVNGWGEEALLDAYDTERRSIAIRNSGSSTQNYEVWRGAGMDLSLVLDDGPEADAQRAEVGGAMSDKLKNEWHSDGIRMGYRYEGSPVVIADGTPEPADDPVVYEPTARPGHRAPHAVLADGRSTIDLFGRGFTLLRLGAAPPDPAELVATAEQRGVPLAVYTIDDTAIAKLYQRSLVLVRPDGHVAWRSDDAPAAFEALAIVDGVRGVQPATVRTRQSTRS